MKANFVTHTESFLWEDLSVDRGNSLDDLILAQKCATDHGDKIFSSPHLINIDLSWGSLFELTTKTQAEILVTCPWLSRDHQKFLAKIINGAPSQKKSTSLTELHLEFPKENNSWLGLVPRDLPKYVHNESSWENLHRENIWEFYSSIDKTTSYFKRFYHAKLTVNAGALKRSIASGKELEIFKRLDTPTVVKNQETLHGEQIQMHFNDKGNSALNLNGEWKHGGFDIPRKARIQLIEWGFKVPD